MFKRTKFKIQYTILLFLSIFLFIETLFTILTINKETLNIFQNNVNNSIDLSINNCKASIISAINASTTLTKKNAPINKKNIDDLKQISFCINGVIYYELDGNIINSSGMSGIPSLNEISNDTNIKSFMNDPNIDYYFSLRTTLIPSYYTSTYYDPSYGIISYIHKIYQSDILVGYLFIDISPYFLYQNYFDYSTYNYFNNYASFIVFNNNQYFYYQENDHYENYLMEIHNNDDKQIIISQDKKMFIVIKYISEIDTNIVVVVPRTFYYETNFQIIFPIVLVTFIFIVLSIFMGFLISKNTVDSLKNLQNKMLTAPEHIKKTK